jgi:putative phage-type endonuclease
MTEQGSPEWLAERLGKLTASRFSDAIAKTKSGWGASRSNLMGELIAERLTGVSAERFANGAMQWGTATEPEARAAYEFRTDQEVLEVGFIPHPKIAMSGASPDGYVGDDGLVEIKAPLTATHIETMLGQSVPSKYVTQMMWQMSCTRRKWCDFVSYDPRLPESMRMFVKRVERDDKLIKDLEAQAADFLAELDAKLAALIALYERKEAA